LYYFYSQYQGLQQNNNDIISKATILQNKVKQLENDLTIKKQKIDVLNKLITFDEELLKKYSRVYFLNENYVPANLVNVDASYVINKKNIQVFDKIDFYLENMLQDANASGVPLRVVSAYRSFATQKNIKTQYVMTYGEYAANKFSADQGYSEHQLGTTLDFTTPSIVGAYSSFQYTTAYTWLKDNAYKYGFIISYPKENKYYKFEPWHWRFVGRELATYIHENNKYFYELDQRFIDTYLIKIFD
jgi:D-alanyl-D-alanine carboxypeptidase